jgi:hypothetical protein
MSFTTLFVSRFPSKLRVSSGNEDGLKPRYKRLQVVGAEGGTRPLPSAGVHHRAPSALSPWLSSTNVRHYPLLSAGYGVRKGVSQEYSSTPLGRQHRTGKPIQSPVMVGRAFSGPRWTGEHMILFALPQVYTGVCGQ